MGCESSQSWGIVVLVLGAGREEWGSLFEADVQLRNYFFARLQGIHHAGDTIIGKDFRSDLTVDVICGKKAQETSWWYIKLASDVHT